MRNLYRQFSIIIAVVLAIAAGERVAFTQATVREYEQDGVRYRETRQVTKRPINEVQYEQQQRTVYKEKYDTKVQTNYRTVMTPVTEYRSEPYLANRWNPFATPYWTYQYVPTTRWEARREEIRTPITQRNWVPEQQTVSVPKTTQRMVQDEVVSKIAIGTAGNTANGVGSIARGFNAPGNASGNISTDPFAAGGPSAVANRNSTWGGVKLDGEPSRDPLNAWRPAEPVRR